MINRNLVMEKLKKCIDPELGINVVDLGLIYDVKINNQAGHVEVVQTLTTPGCPLSPYFVEEVTKQLKEIDEVKDVQVTLTFDPPWSPEKIQNQELRLMLGI